MRLKWIPTKTVIILGAARNNSELQQKRKARNRTSHHSVEPKLSLSWANLHNPFLGNNQRPCCKNIFCISLQFTRQTDRQTVEKQRLFLRVPNREDENWRPTIRLCILNETTRRGEWGKEEESATDHLLANNFPNIAWLRYTLKYSHSFLYTTIRIILMHLKNLSGEIFNSCKTNFHLFLWLFELFGSLCISSIIIYLFFILKLVWIGKKLDKIIIWWNIFKNTDSKKTVLF